MKPAYFDYSNVTLPMCALRFWLVTRHPSLVTA
jgi:hypothetical protein